MKWKIKAMFETTIQTIYIYIWYIYGGFLSHGGFPVVHLIRSERIPHPPDPPAWMMLQGLSSCTKRSNMASWAASPGEKPWGKSTGIKKHVFWWVVSSKNDGWDEGWTEKQLQLEALGRWSLNWTKILLIWPEDEKFCKKNAGIRLGPYICFNGNYPMGSDGWHFLPVWKESSCSKTMSRRKVVSTYVSV